MGYSVGKWEGDTLVVETNGLNNEGWLDMNGHPQTEAVHLTERFRRRNFGHIAMCKSPSTTPRRIPNPGRSPCQAWILLQTKS
jgi:hypothetical protein